MVMMERREKAAAIGTQRKDLVPILKKRSSFSVDYSRDSPRDSPPKEVYLNTDTISVQEIINEESYVPQGSPTFERVMRDLSDNFRISLQGSSADSSLSSIPDACERSPDNPNKRNVRIIQRSNSCAFGKKKSVRFPGRQMSQSFKARDTAPKVTLQRQSSFLRLEKRGSPNTFKFISSNESYSHEESQSSKRGSIFELPDRKLIERKLAYGIASTLS